MVDFPYCDVRVGICFPMRVQTEQWWINVTTRDVNYEEFKIFEIPITSFLSAGIVGWRKKGNPFCKIVRIRSLASIARVIGISKKCHSFGTDGT